ncbi:MAG: type II toxin-antitoxin system VapC family toxin [bacterium]|nr:type II toxin-antitoxin system VapC family toxin [bacterium]
MTRLLLDTHVLLWWWTDDHNLSNRARLAVGDPDADVHVSAASAWEISTLWRLGRIDHAPGAVSRFHELVEADGFRHLAITHFHCLRAGGYPTEHRDPFDRLLAAQSELEGLTLVTRDTAFTQFPAVVLW